MSENYRKPIGSLNKLPQFTTMNVIDGQAGLIIYTSLIFYSLTIDNILNIIVLLILAGISIATLTGENGILTQANNAKTQAGVGEEKEAIGLAYNGAKTEKLGGEITSGDLNLQFTKNGVNATASGTGTITVTFPDTSRSYTIDSNGNITGPTTSDEQTGKWAEPYDIAGFTHTIGEWDTGYVIQDNTTGSEFVWIPVGGTINGTTINLESGEI